MSEKGKYASGTQNRRFVWKEIVWPLILELDEVAFTLEQYQEMRDNVCRKFNVSFTIASRGLVSLLQKNILYKENDLYSIHYRLIPYMRLRADCDYATALREVRG